MVNIPISERYALSLEEAAIYFRVGVKKLREMINSNPRADWYFRSGTHTFIKRPMLEKLFDRIDTV